VFFLFCESIEKSFVVGRLRDKEDECC